MAEVIICHLGGCKDCGCSLGFTLSRITPSEGSHVMGKPRHGETPWRVKGLKCPVSIHVSELGSGSSRPSQAAADRSPGKHFVAS